MESEELFAQCHDLADASPYPMAAFRGPDHRLAYANPAFRQVTERTGVAAMGSLVTECLPHCPGCVALLTRVSETGVPESHTEAGYSDSWSYSGWPIYKGTAPALTMLQVTETSELHQRSTSMNEALLVSAVQQHELAQQAKDSAVQMSSEVSQKTAELDHTKEELRWLALRLLQAQEDERQRIARELHDHFSQELASVGMQLFDLAKPLTLDAPQMVALARLQEQIGRLSSGIRTLSHQLHSPALEDLGLTASLYGLLENFETKHNLAVRPVIRDVPRDLALPIATAVYRVAQEALWNAVKHAGPDALVTVRLSHERDLLTLCIEDTGQGFDPQATRGKGGLGLISMQERMRLVGGSLLVDAEAGEGTKIRAEVPCQL